METNADRLAAYPRFFDEPRETMEPSRRMDLILEKVRAQLRYVYEELPFYRNLYDEYGLNPDGVNSLEDFARKVPIVTKDMLLRDQEAHPPYGSYAGVEPREIQRIFASSGTTGTPTVYGISDHDWERAKQAQAMAVWAMGARPSDVVHFVFPFSMFVGGWAILLGCDAVGATCFPAGALDSHKHIDMMHQVGSTILAGTPSYCLHLAEVAKEMGVDLRKTKLHTLIVGGEPGGTLPGPCAAMREAYGDVVIADTGNTSEAFPTQMNSSCAEGTGVHVFEDEVFLEVVDPDDTKVVQPEGQRGAAVYTTLARKSQPVIRFWAGDETYMTREPCPCGRTYPRLPEGLVGRLDDMLLVRGANVYPSAIENALRQVQGVGAEYRVLVEKRGAMDEIRIEAEYEPVWLSSQANVDDAKRDLVARIESGLKRHIGLRCPVDLVEPGTHEAQLFKARRVVDQRGEA